MEEDKTESEITEEKKIIPKFDLDEFKEKCKEKMEDVDVMNPSYYHDRLIQLLKYAVLSLIWSVVMTFIISLFSNDKSGTFLDFLGWVFVIFFFIFSIVVMVKNKISAPIVAMSSS